MEQVLVASFPDDSDNYVLSPDLREIVARLCEKADSLSVITMFAENGGIRIANVEQSPIAKVYWHNIVKEAHKIGRLENLVEEVYRHYPDPRLREILEQTTSEIRNLGIALKGGEPTSPLIVGDLPLGSVSFVGREADLAWLSDALRPSLGVSVAAVTGLHGLGKTQLARTFVVGSGAQFTKVIWISAEDGGLLAATSAEVAAELGLPSFIPERPESAIPAIRRHLEQTPNALAVVDSASPSRAHELVPRQGTSAVLITSNSPNWFGLTRNVRQLQPLDESSSVNMLVDRTADCDLASAKRIADTIENHPLALEQAASYMVGAAVTLAQYADVLEERLGELLELPRELFAYPRSVVAAIRLSIEQIPPHSTSLLFFLAQFGRSAIPRWLATEGMSLVVDDDGKPCDELCLGQAVLGLADASLVRTSVEAFSIHAIVRAVAISLIPGDQKDAWSRHAVASLAANLEWPVESRSSWEQWNRNIELIFEVFKSINWEIVERDDGVIALVSTAILQLVALGQFDRAQMLAKAVLEHARKVSFDHPPEIAGALVNFSATVKREGATEEAVSPLLEAISILEGVHDPDIDTQWLLGVAYSNLAGLYFDDTDESTWQPSYELWGDAYRLHESTFGSASINATIDLNNMARVLRARGEWEEAYKIWKKVVRQHRRNLSNSDYRLSVSLYNLATAAFNLGKCDEAARLLLEAEAMDDDLFDEVVVWSRLATIEGMAQLYDSMGNLTASLRAYDKALPMAIALYGERSAHVRSVHEARQSVVDRIDVLVDLKAACAVIDESGYPLWCGRPRTMRLPLEFFMKFRDPQRPSPSLPA